MAADFEEMERAWAQLPPLAPEVAFYLQNQARIEEWAALKERARPVVDAFYGALAARLQREAPEQIFLERQSEWSMVLWRRADWAHARGIGLCWREGDLSSCFSGVRLEPGDPQVEAVLAHPAAQGGLSSEYWTIWRPEPVPSPLDLAAMADEASAQVARLWRDFAPLMGPA